jgi:ureidoglycolate lyase
VGETVGLRSLTKNAFKPFGHVIEAEGLEGQPINNGTALRFHALAPVHVIGVAGHPVISIFRGQCFRLPLTIVAMERHPFGSQALIPIDVARHLVVVAPDEGGVPGWPQAFLASGRQGVSYARNVWHHSLMPLDKVAEFLVVDGENPSRNLETARYPEPFELCDDIA